MLSLSAERRNVYYLQDGDDGISVGTIISDGSVKVIGFVQDINVSLAG